MPNALKNQLNYYLSCGQFRGKFHLYKSERCKKLPPLSDKTKRSM